MFVQQEMRMTCGSRSNQTKVQSVPKCSASSNKMCLKPKNNFMATLSPSRSTTTVLCVFAFSYTKPGDWVLDLFCGSGTTLEATVYLGRNVLGSDTRPDQIQATIARMDLVMRKENTVLKPGDQALNRGEHPSADVPAIAKAKSSSSEEAEEDEQDDGEDEEEAEEAEEEEEVKEGGKQKDRGGQRKFG